MNKIEKLESFQLPILIEDSRQLNFFNKGKCIESFDPVYGLYVDGDEVVVQGIYEYRIKINEFDDVSDGKSFIDLREGQFVLYKTQFHTWLVEVIYVDFVHKVARVKDLLNPDGIEFPLTPLLIDNIIEIYDEIPKEFLI